VPIVVDPVGTFRLRPKWKKKIALASSVFALMATAAFAAADNSAGSGSDRAWTHQMTPSGGLKAESGGSKGQAEE
jgi:hypothetical protein